MSEKHYPYFGGSFDRIVFDGDGSVWVPEAENAKLRELVKEMRVCLEDECKRCHEWGNACDLEHQMRELGIEAG